LPTIGIRRRFKSKGGEEKRGLLKIERREGR